MSGANRFAIPTVRALARERGLRLDLGDSPHVYQLRRRAGEFPVAKFSSREDAVNWLHSQLKVQTVRR